MRYLSRKYVIRIPSSTTSLRHQCLLQLNVTQRTSYNLVFIQTSRLQRTMICIGFYELSAFSRQLRDRLKSAKLKTTTIASPLLTRVPQLFPDSHGLYMVLLQPLALKNISQLIFKDFILGKEFNVHFCFCNNFNRVAIIDYRAPQLVPQMHCLYMVFLQPLVLKKISLLIFEELFSNNFKSVAIIDSRAPRLVPQRLGLIMVRLQPLVWKNMGHTYMEQVLGLLS